MFCGPAYPEERAEKIIPLWRDFMKTAPERLSGLAEFSTVPSDASIPEHAWGRRVVALAHVYDGPADEASRWPIILSMPRKLVVSRFTGRWV